LRVLLPNSELYAFVWELKRKTDVRDPPVRVELEDFGTVPLHISSHLAAGPAN
jgi:hypothetical protein